MSTEIKTTLDSNSIRNRPIDVVENDLVAVIEESQSQDGGLFVYDRMSHIFAPAQVRGDI